MNAALAAPRITVEGQTYVAASPATEADRFYVIATPEAHDQPRLAAESKTYKNAAKRASELMAKRYNWDAARVMILAP